MTKISALFLSFIMLVSISTGYGNDKEKNSFLWLDAHANFKRLGTEEGVVEILTRAKDAGFKNVILDLRGIDGYVLYPSKIAPVLSEHYGYKRAPDYDYPAVVINEARKLNLGIYFSMNVFSEGNKENHLGLGYGKFSDLQVQVYTKDGIVPISKSNEEIAVFLNPLFPEVRKYELSVIEEMLRMYKPDGIVLDRSRFPNISGDFSTASRDSFEKFIGEKITNWPYDIYKIETTADNKVNRVSGKYYKKWLLWRAKIIHDFFNEARDRVKSINQEYAFSDYVGSWYPVYYDVGVNWASNKYHTEKDYDWADSAYYQTGYAQLLDFLFVGNYFVEVTKEEAIKVNTPTAEIHADPGKYWWYSVEGSAELAMKVVDNAAPVYGSLWANQFIEKKDPERFVTAMKQAIKSTNGLMLFDVSEIEENNWWNYIKEALNN